MSLYNTQLRLSLALLWLNLLASSLVAGSRPMVQQTLFRKTRVRAHFTQPSVQKGHTLPVRENDSLGKHPGLNVHRRSIAPQIATEQYPSWDGRSKRARCEQHVVDRHNRCPRLQTCTAWAQARTETGEYYTEWSFGENFRTTRDNHQPAWKKARVMNPGQWHLNNSNGCLHPSQK